MEWIKYEINKLFIVGYAVLLNVKNTITDRNVLWDCEWHHFTTFSENKSLNVHCPNFIICPFLCALCHEIFGINQESQVGIPGHRPKMIYRFICSLLIHSFKSHVSSSYCVPDSVVDTRNTAISKITQNVCLQKSLHSTIGRDRKKKVKEINTYMLDGDKLFLAKSSRKST